MATKKKGKLNEQIGNFIRVHLPTFKDAIKQVETEVAQSAPGTTGAQKLERAVEIVNGLIDIPIVPEWMEEMVFKAIITTLVEAFNAHFGKGEWLDKV